LSLRMVDLSVSSANVKNVRPSVLARPKFGLLALLPRKLSTFAISVSVSANLVFLSPTLRNLQFYSTTTRLVFDGLTT
jgi:hypothetical protein